MGVPLSTMRDEVKKVLVDRADVDSLIDRWLNDAQLMLATQLRIRELEAASTLTAVISPVTDIYAIPEDMWAPIYLLNTSKAEMEIKLSPLEKVLKRPKTPVGDPDIYAVRGNTFIFRPAFKNTDVIELTYKVKVPLMVAGIVDMFLPDEFRRVVVMDAAAYSMHILQEEERAQAYIAIRNSELQKIGDQRGEEFIAREMGMLLTWSGRESSGRSVTGVP